MDTQKAIETVFAYHERTKHHPDRYAMSPRHLDWANEPHPFRTYEGADRIRLPLLERDPDANHFCLYDRSSPRPRPCSLKNIAAFLELSMGLSAWKSYQGSKWALRINPSSGNLHPSEAYLVLPPIGSQNEGGVFHYNPFFHALERRISFGKTFWNELRRDLGAEGFLVGLTSIPWRESWKYGERAFRYCQHDIGHAIACLSFSANLLGWKATWLSGLSEKDIGEMLGFQKTKWHRSEQEYADLMMLVHPQSERPSSDGLSTDTIASFSTLDYVGAPNLLSKRHAEWDIVDEVAVATEKPRLPEPPGVYGSASFVEREISGRTAVEAIRRRRSAQAYDARTGISKESFFAILDKTLPRVDFAPFDAAPSRVSVHLAVFVHRVEGLYPGLYMLLRDEAALEEIRARCDSRFLWQHAIDAPDTLPLYLLQRNDLRNAASTISCHQEIAADGAFSIGMLATFRSELERHPWLYRKLFWETGMVGQVLYLEAEAHALRGTGIGCFFDDLMHRLLGLKDDSYQSLYHFTVGGPLEDERLTTMPPYHHFL